MNSSLTDYCTRSLCQINSNKVIDFYLRQSDIDYIDSKKVWDMVDNKFSEQIKSFNGILSEKEKELDTEHDT